MSARTPFTSHSGLVAPLPMGHIDTDQIVPKQFLQLLERTGYGQFLFHSWRFDGQGAPRPEFVLNQPQYAGATILVAGENFGCGSSREHAAWAIADFGFRVVVAPSFADIFLGNAVVNGILPATVSAEVAAEIAQRAAQRAPYRLTVDLVRCTLHDDFGLDAVFTIDPGARARLLEGRDEVDRILAYEADIRAFETRRAETSWTQPVDAVQGAGGTV